MGLPKICPSSLHNCCDGHVVTQNLDGEGNFKLSPGQSARGHLQTLALLAVFLT